MRPLSPSTQALADRLRAHAMRFAERVELIELVARSGEEAAILPLVGFLAEEPPLARAASKAIARLLEGRRASLYLELEGQRRVLGTGPSDGWHRLTPGRLADLAALPEAWVALGFASLHRNGHVREAAVRALAARPPEGGQDVPFLLLRANDWVAPVRAAARAALSPRLRPELAPVLVAALPLVRALESRRRADHGAVVGAVVTLLCTPEARPALLDGTTSADASVRRDCHQLALRNGPVDERLLGRALADPDVGVRLLAAAAMARLPDETARLALLDRALRDRAAPVRRAVLHLVASAAPVWRRRVADTLACDVDPEVRRFARATLSGLDPAFDARARYLAALGASRSDTVRGALLGLADLGDPADVLAMEPLCRHGSARVRATALATAGRLDRESIEPFLGALVDSSRRVAQTASSILQARASTVVAERVLSMIDRPDLPPHVAVSALGVLDRLSPWSRCTFLLRAMLSRHAATAARARERLDAHTFVEPTPQDLADVERALAQVPPGPETAAVAREVRFWRRR